MGIHECWQSVIRVVPPNLKCLYCFKVHTESRCAVEALTRHLNYLRYLYGPFPTLEKSLQTILNMLLKTKKITVKISDTYLFYCLLNICLFLKYRKVYSQTRTADEFSLIHLNALYWGDSGCSIYSP